MKHCTHIVIKKEDVPEHIFPLVNTVLIEVVCSSRKAGKSVDPTYIVVNTDEPYADEIRQIIIREHGECGV